MSITPSDITGRAMIAYGMVQLFFGPVSAATRTPEPRAQSRRHSRRCAQIHSVAASGRKPRPISRLQIEAGAEVSGTSSRSISSESRPVSRCRSGPR